MIVVTLVGGLIVRRGGWGLLGGVLLLLALVALLFVIGLVLLLAFVVIWIVQASRQP